MIVVLSCEACGFSSKEKQTNNDKFNTIHHQNLVSLDLAGEYLQIHKDLNVDGLNIK